MRHLFGVDLLDHGLGIEPPGKHISGAQREGGHEVTKAPLKTIEPAQHHRFRPHAPGIAEQAAVIYTDTVGKERCPWAGPVVPLVT